MPCYPNDISATYNIPSVNMVYIWCNFGQYHGIIKLSCIIG